MAERTGLEPATSGVTGRRSNRLNYRSTEDSASGGKQSGDPKRRVPAGNWFF